MKSLKIKWSIALLLSLQIILGNLTFGQSAGFNTSYAIMSINGAANAYYDLQATTGNPDFNGANLGTFNPASNSLTLRGAEHNVYKCGSSDLTSTRLMYRIYLSSGVGGSFTSLNVPFTSGGANGCSGQDQQWSLTGHNLNVLSGLAPGAYTLEVYSEATVTNCCGGTVYASGSGNYKATFTVSGTNYVTTNNSSGLASSYATLAAAITALNAATITSPVLITLHGNETAPAGGYNITKSGTSTNTITIQGTSPSTTIVTASTGHTAGALNDAIFKITGADWITIRNFTMQESANTTTAAGTNNMTEFGVALFYASTTDGAQNNTIQGNTISLNRTYSNTFGIYSNTRHSATAVTTTAQSTTSAGANSFNKIYSNSISNVDYGIVFVGSSTAAAMDNGNDIGGSTSITGNTITNWGGLVSGAISGYISVTGSNTGIFMNHQINDNVSFNTVTSATNITTLTTTQIIGILKSYTATSATGTITATYNNNTITLTNAPTTSQMSGISLQGLTALSTATFSCNNNNILNCALTGASATTASIIGIFTIVAPGTLNITGNTIRGLSSTVTGAGSVIGIQQQTNGVVTALNITNNKFGDATAGFLTYSSANSATVTGISVTSTGAASTCALAITGNDFRGITHSAAGSGAHTYIINAATSLSQNISSNTFTNLNVNTTGSVSFVVNAISLTATGTMNVNSNSIVTGFNKGGAGGTVTFYSSNASSSTGSIINFQNNNFSNITLTGLTAFVGINNTDGGSPTKTITGNTFDNISGGSGAINPITINFMGSTSSVSNNTVSNITWGAACTGITIGTSSATATTLNVSNNVVSNIVLSTGAATGISVGSPATTTVNINGNNVNSLSSTGATAVQGIVHSGSSTTANIFNNRIYNLSGSNASSTVNGMLLSAGATVNAYNNRIGDLTASSASTADAVRGISITSTTSSTTYRLYYNTVRLSGTSSAGTFGGSGIFHTTSGTSTTAALDMRNNLIINAMTPTGAGLAVAYRRSNNTLANYSTNSNNNSFFGTSGLFTDGTNTFTLLADYKTSMSTRDQASQNANPTFLSLSGASSNFLKVDPNASTIGIEGAGQNIATYTTDFEGDARNGSTPDIGADEFATVYACSTTPSPANSATAVAQTTTLSWAASANATSYDVYFGTDGSATNIVNGTNQVGTTYTPGSTLAASTTYYWKIIPKNGSNAATGCATWSFTTDAAVPALTPTSLTAFGNVCTSATATNTFSMTAVNLTGTFVTITAPTGYTVSEDNSTFASSINVNHTSGAFSSKVIYVKFAPSSATSFSGNVVISGGGLSSSVNVAASGTGIDVVSGLTYSTPTAVYCATVAITSNTPTLSVSGGTVGYSINNSLASGLSFSSSTGIISGTPAAAASIINYTITSTNACGSTNAPVSITVVNRVTSLVYTSSTITTCAGSPITTNNVSSVTAGSGTLTYSVLPALPSGLSLDANTGAISGTSSAIQVSTPYTITVSNGCSSTTATVNIAINATFSGTYSVGAGQAYTTLTAAVAAYNNSCLTGPVVFNLTDASYSTSETFPITINENTGANATNTLTIKPASGVTATITGSNSASLLRFNSADYVILDGSNNGTTSRDLTISNTNTGTSSAVIWIQSVSSSGSTNNVVRNCNITGNASTTTLFGIGMGSSTMGTSSLGTNNNNNTIQNNNFRASQYGIYTQGNSIGTKNTGNILTNNLINNTSPNNIGVMGILVGFENNILISGNNISEINGSADRAAINLGWGTAFSGATTTGNEVTNATISTNIIGNVIGSGTNTSFGICVASASTGTTTISNNMIYGVSHNSTSPDIAAGIALGGGTGSTTNVYYNTISMQGTMASGTAGSMASTCLAVTNATMGTINVRNNIFTNTQSGNTSATTRFSTIGLTASTLTGFSSDYNDLISSGSGPGTYVIASTGGITGGTTFTFATWETSASQDLNSVNITPVFTSASNLRLVTASNTLLNNLGTTVSVTTDIDGVTRGASPDMGVNEFTPPADDAGISAAVTNYCPGSQSVSVTLNNFGLTTLTSATIDWSINGVAQTPYNWTGSIASGTTSSVTIGTFTFVAATNYTLIATSSLPNGFTDATSGNDSFTSSTFQTGLSGTYTVGTGQTFTTITAAVAAANSFGICGPTVFSLTDASYSSSETFPITINELLGSNSTNTLKIKPASGNTATITGSNASAIIKLNGADNIIIDGSNNGTTSRNLTVANTNTGTSSSVIWLASIASPANGATNNIIENLIVTGNAATTTFAGILTSGASIGAVAEAPNNGNIIDNNLVTSAYYGIGISGATATESSVIVRNNTINTIGLQGIFISNQQGVDVSGNTVSGVSSSSNINTAGIYVVGTINAGTISRNSVSNIKNTTAGGRQSMGIWLVSSSTSSGLTISNNMIYDIANSGNSSVLSRSSHGIYIATGGGYNIYYNSVNLNTNPTAANTLGNNAALYVASGVTSLDIRNNIFANTQSTSVNRFAIYSDAANTAFSTINYNNYFSSGTAIGYIGSARTLLADVVTGFGQNANSTAILPTFVSSTDMHLNTSVNSSLNNTGVFISSFTTDYDGETRNGSTPDMGADEWTPLVCSTADGGTASALVAAFCTTGSTTISSTGYSIGAGTTYEWERATDLAFTTPVSMGAANAVYANLSTGTITTTTYYRLKVICSAGIPAYSNVTTVTINANPTITPSSAASICSGNSTTLTASGASTYTWAPSTGLSATTGNSVSANPTSSTTYTITGTDGNNCSNTATIAVTVSQPPSAITIDQSASTVCANTVATLTATGGTFTNIASNYNVAISSGIALNNVSSPTGNLLSSSLDDNASSATNIGFTFNFAGTDYTQFWVNSNGAVGLGSSTFISTGNSFTTASSYPILLPFNDDLGTNSGGINYKLTGSAPNRVLTIDFQMGDCCGSASAATIVYQVILEETTNAVRFIYSNGLTSGLDGSIGIASSSSSYLSFTAPSNSFSSTTENNLNSTLPTSGTSYLFTPPSSTITWSPTTELYTDIAATTPYSGQNTAVVYAKNTTATAYTATATNGACTTTGNITTSINALPSLSSSSVTICNGQSTPLSVSGASTYSWSPGTGLSTTTGNSVTANPTSTTTYTITGTDGNSCQNTTTTTVTVNPVITITSQPNNAVVLPGTDASFTVSATGVGLSYQWQKSTNSGSSWSNISLATASTYDEIAVTVGMDGYLYRCIIAGAPCDADTTNTVSLSVSSTAITTQPTNATICSNGTALFTIATSGSLPTYQWQISTNSGSSWSDISGETNDTLSISGVTSSNTGTIYRCVLNSGYINSDAGTLTVYDLIAISTHPTTQTICSNASSAVFTVTASGSNPTYQWQVSTNSGGSWSNIALATTSTLTLSTINNSLDGNQYRVIVSGSAPCSSVTSNAATLSVTGVSTVASVSSLCVNASLTLTATPTASSPSLTYSWASEAGSGASTPITTNPAVATPIVAGSYTYTLTATGGGCTITSTQGVTVNALPSITTATATPSPICAGSPISLAASSVNSSAGTAIIGNGSTQGSNSTTFVRVGNSVGNQFKNQYLFTAAELNTAGLTTGNITSLSFDVFVSGGGTVSNLTFRLGTTSLTALTSTYVTGLTQVYTVATYPTSGVLQAGLQTVNFNTPFYWNGTSNLVLEACSQLATTGSAGDLRSGTTSFVSTITNNPTTTACGSATGLGTSSVRPNFRFDGQLGTNVTSGFNWSWNTSPAINAATGSTTAVNNTTSPTTTTNYTVTATNPTTGCVSSLTTSNVTINPMPAVPTANNTSNCGAQNATCSVNGTGLGGNTFRWYTVSSGGTAIAGQTGSSLTAYPVATTTIFYVSETNGNCESARVAVTQTITSAPTISASALPSTICSGQSTTLTASSTNASYTYTWSNSLGSGPAVTASPTFTTTYTVTGNDVSGGVNNGCSASATVLVTVNPLPTVIEINPTAATICSGGIQTLVASGGSTPSTGTVTLGTGTTASTAQATNPFNGSYGGVKSQYIIRASELQALNLGAGNITSLGMFVTAGGANAKQGYAISMAHTSLTVLTSTIVDVSNVVYTNASQTFTNNVLNTLTFSTPFTWDGTSNIIISMCWSNANTSNTANTVRVYAPGYTCSNARLADSRTSSEICSYVGSATPSGWTSTTAVTSTSRPIFTFGGQILTASPITWTPTTNLFTNAGATTAYTGTALNTVHTNSTSTITYTATSTSPSGCIRTQNVLVTVNTPSTSASSLSATLSSICVGEASILTQTGGTIGTGATWKWYSDASYTTLVGSSSASDASLSVTPSANTTYYLRAEGTTSPCVSNVASSGNVPVTVGFPSTVTTLANDDFVWTGTVDSDWTTLNNWRQWKTATSTFVIPSGIPNTSSVSVILPAVTGCVVNAANINASTVSVNNLTIESGHTFALNNASSILNIAGSLTNNGTWGTPTTGSTVNFNGSGSQTIPTLAYSNLQTATGGTKTLAGTTNVSGVVTIVASSTLSLGANTLNLSFIGTPLVITGTFTPSTGTVNYSGAGSQDVAATTYYNLGTTGTGSKTLAGTVSVSNAMELTDGTLTLGANTFNMNGSILTRISGSIDASNASATLVFGNSSLLTLPASVFSAAVNNLTLNSNRVLASNDFSVNGILNLNNSNPDATNGLLDLIQSYGNYGNTNSADGTSQFNDLSSVVLTLGSSATVTGAGDVSGKVRRTSFSDGVTYAFGNKDMQLTFDQNGGASLPSQITVVSTKGNEGLHVDKDGTSDFATGDELIGGAAVRRLVQILRTGGSEEVLFTARFPYSDSELNGNTEANLVVWNHELPYAGRTPHEQGQTDLNTTDNWIETSGHGVEFLATEGNTLFTKYWMLGQKETTVPMWLGAASGSLAGAWNTPSNWSTGVVPTDVSIIIPNATKTANDPDASLLPATVSLATIEIQTGGILNGGSSEIILTGGPAANSGRNSWLNSGTFNAGTGKVTFDYTSATISGTTAFNDLTVNAGKQVTILANSNNSISGTVVNDGTLDATTNANTITYNGSGQTVIQPNGAITGYYNLTINQASGTALATNQIFTLGNLLVENGTFDLQGNSAYIEGNLINNDVISNANEIYMSGTSNQSIGGTSPITTEILLLTGSGGTTTFNQDVIVNQVLLVEVDNTLNGGTSEIKLNAPGDPFILEGSFVSGTGTVNYAAADATNILPINYYNLKSEGAATKTLTGNTTVSNVLTVDESILDASAFTLSIGTSPVTMNSGALSIENGTLELTNASAMSIPASLIVNSTFNNLSLLGVGGATLNDDMTLNGDLVLTAGSLNLGSTMLTMETNATMSRTSGLINTGTGGLIFKAANLDASALASGNIHKLEINRTGDVVEMNNGNLNVTNTFTLTDGTLDINANELRFSGGITHNGGDIDADAGTVDFNNTGAYTLSNGLFGGNIHGLKVTGAGGLTLSDPIKVSNALTMSGGNVTTANSSLLEIGTSTSTVGSITWNSGTIVGPLRRWFAAATNSSQASGIFPVGTSDFNRYAQVNFTEAPEGGYLEIEYKDGLAPDSYDNLPLAFSENSANKYIQNADEEGYWEMKPYSSSGTLYGALDAFKYDLYLRINNPASVQNGGILNNPPGVRLIRAKGNPDGSHEPWSMAGTYSTAIQMVEFEDYIIKSVDVEGFSWFNGGGDNQNPLPIELLSFAGNCLGNEVTLNWTTASEFNNNYFVIEKSRDGVNWNTIHTEQGAGTSFQKLNYAFVEENQTEMESYYRLSQVDIDGENEIFDPIFVGCLNETSIFKTYPNPSDDSFQILVNNESLVGKATIQVLDTKGTIVSVKEVEITEGTNLFYLYENMAPGIYYLSISNGTNSTEVVKHSVK